jgi:hypothetical protein
MNSYKRKSRSSDENPYYEICIFHSEFKYRIESCSNSILILSSSFRIYIIFLLTCGQIF